MSQHDRYISPFSTRYASDEMQYIFSDDNKFRTWRRLWVALARAEMDQGLTNITPDMVAELEAHVDDINYEVAIEREKLVRHDVMSHVYAYGQQCPKAAGIIHLGATSCYVGDNTDIIVMRQGLELVRKKLVGVLAKLAHFAKEYKDMPCMAYTHCQPAQPTTVGKRATLWANELVMDLAEIDHRLATLQLRGVKGTTGTQASFMELFKGDADKIRAVDASIAKEMGFDPKAVVPVSGQTYSRKVDAFILNALAPSLKLDYEAEELPISVKPDKQVSVTDVMALLRETYEGTPLDMTQNLKVTVKDRKTGKVDTIISPKANPWMRGDELNMLNGIKKGVVKSVRNIAVPQCAYSTVIQLRNWLPDAVGGVVWFSMDNPGQSPRVPVFCGITDFPAMYKICGNHRYRDDAALWHYRRANKLAAVRWGTARKVMEKNIRHFEEKGQRELPFVEAQYQSILQSKGEEAARAYLTDYTADFIGATILRWDEMANQYWIESRFGF